MYKCKNASLSTMRPSGQPGNRAYYTEKQGSCSSSTKNKPVKNAPFSPKKAGDMGKRRYQICDINHTPIPHTAGEASSHRRQRSARIRLHCATDHLFRQRLCANVTLGPKRHTARPRSTALIIPQKAQHARLLPVLCFRLPRPTRRCTHSVSRSLL